MVLALLTSCNDFDVQPKGQNTEDQMFTTITGCEDAVCVYGKLASNLYGESFMGACWQAGQEFGYANRRMWAIILNRYQYNNQASFADRCHLNMYSNIAMSTCCDTWTWYGSAPQEVMPHMVKWQWCSHALRFAQAYTVLTIPKRRHARLHHMQPVQSKEPLK